MTKSNTYCALPWIHLGTHPHGGVTPCCISDMTAGKNRARNYTASNDQFLNLNEHSIDAHMNSDYYKQIRLEMLEGKKPSACMRCYEEESKGIISKRQYEQTQYPDRDYRWASGVTADDGAINTSLEFVELRLGNVCNVQCRTCNPASSSKWRRDYEEVVEKLEFVNDGYSWLDHKRDFKWPESDSFYEDLYECAPQMRVLYINGGEPTLIKAHWRYLRKLVESGRSKDIVLWYNINMTNLPAEARELWSEFKETRLCASVDDIELRNHYIRYPTFWSDVKTNLNTVLEWSRTCPSIVVRITTTVSAYNFPYLDLFLKWAPCPVDLNYVYDPHYLSPAVLHPDIRARIFDRYRTTMGNDPHLGSLLSMYNNSEWNPEHWTQFCRYNAVLDAQRGAVTWDRVYPDLVALCAELNIKWDYK